MLQKGLIKDPGDSNLLIGEQSHKKDILKLNAQLKLMVKKLLNMSRFYLE